MKKLPSLEQMLKAGMHFGHRKSRWHPKMEPFIFTQRNNVHIINLSKSRELLSEALEFIKKTVSENKTILFVGTKNQVKKPLKKLALDSGMPYICEKWLGGCLTNFLIIKKTIKKYIDLVNKKESGKLTKYTKKEQLDFDRQITKLDLKVGGLVTLNKLPEVMFIWDIKKEKTALVEAKKRNITIIAICDTNVNPTGIDYVIPSNDDATKTIELVLESVAEAIKEGKLVN